MSRLRVRIAPDTPRSGQFEWATPRGAETPGRWGPGSRALTGECEVVVPSEMVALQRMEVPAAQAARITGSLRFLVEDRIISEPERTHVASARCGGNAHCMAIVDRQWLRAALDRVREAGLSPRAAYPECLLPGWAAATWTVVCGPGEAFARTGEWSGFSLGPVDAGDPPSLLRFALEAAPPKRIVVRAARGAPLPDPRRWSDALGLPVEAGPPWDWSKSDSPPKLDLLQGEFSAGAGADGAARLRRAALLALAVVAVFSGGIALEWTIKARERSALLAEMQRIHRETHGDKVPAIDPPAQMRQALSALDQRSGRMAQGDFIALLAAFSARALDPGADRVQHLSYEGSTLTVVVQPADPKRLAAAAARSKGSGLDLRLEETDWGGKGAVRVSVGAEKAR